MKSWDRVEQLWREAKDLRSKAWIYFVHWLKRYAWLCAAFLVALALCLFGIWRFAFDYVVKLNPQYKQYEVGCIVSDEFRDDVVTSTQSNRAVQSLGPVQTDAVLILVFDGLSENIDLTKVTEQWFLYDIRLENVTDIVAGRFQPTGPSPAEVAALLVFSRPDKKELKLKYGEKATVANSVSFATVSSAINSMGPSWSELEFERYMRKEDFESMWFLSSSNTRIEKKDAFGVHGERRCQLLITAEAGKFVLSIRLLILAVISLLICRIFETFRSLIRDL